MSERRIVVIGASAAGLRAAARARRLLPDARITVLDQATEISVGACGLPYVLSGDVDDADELRRTAYGMLRDPEFFSRVKGLDVQTGRRVEALDLAAHEVRGRSLADGAEFVTSYDSLVVATGGTGLLPFPGVAPSDRIRLLRSLEDLRVLKGGLEAGRTGSVVVIGGGFIGCEAAEACGALWGAEVTLVEALPQVLGGILDPEMAAVLEAHLRGEDVTLHLGEPVETLRETDGGVEVTLASGTRLTADAAICALGVRPAVDFARAAGLEVGPRGGLLVDGQMRTSHPDVYAAGDCVELTHHLSGRPLYLPLGSLANRHGRLIADVLAGRDRRRAPVVGSAAVKVFERHAAATGLTEQAARDAGLEVRTAWGTFDDRADYHPDAGQIHLKAVYEAGTERLLGLQGVGQGQVVREIDTAAALLQHDGTVQDLLDLECAYAPPYAAAVSPLHHLAAVIRNAEEDGLVGLPPGADLDGAVVLDVRAADEVAARPAVGDAPVTIPLEAVRARLAEVPPGRVVVTCARGTRSYEVARILQQAGRTEVGYLGGGLNLRRP